VKQWKPDWTVNLTPFHHVALVPAESFKAVAAIVMLAIAGVAMLLAVRLFKRRDLSGS
jgi:ABC-2 type transport system permease protein